MKNNVDLVFKCSGHNPGCFKTTMNAESSPDLQSIVSTFDIYTSVRLSLCNF